MSTKICQMKMFGEAPAPAAKETAPKKRERDLVWDAWVEIFQLPTVHKSDCTRVGKMVSILKSRNATPELIKEMVRRYKTHFAQMPCTADAVINQWAFLLTVDAGNPDVQKNRTSEYLRVVGERMKTENARIQAGEAERMELEGYSDEELQSVKAEVVRRSRNPKGAEIMFRHSDPRNSVYLRRQVVQVIRSGFKPVAAQPELIDATDIPE